MAFYVVNKQHHVSTICDIYIGRGSPVGNPFPLSQYSRGESISKYAAELSLCMHTKRDTKYFKYEEVRRYLNSMWWMNRYEGRCNLVCYCAPLPCHGDVLKGILDAVME